MDLSISGWELFSGWSSDKLPWSFVLVPDFAGVSIAANHYLQVK